MHASGRAVPAPTSMVAPFILVEASGSQIEVRCKANDRYKPHDGLGCHSVWFASAHKHLLPSF